MEKDIFNTPMVLIAHAGGTRKVVYSGRMIVADPDKTVTLAFGAGNDSLYYYLNEPDDISISEIGKEQIRIRFNTELDLDYTIRPVKDDDAMWILVPFGISIPTEALEKVLEIMAEDQASGNRRTSGIPSVSAITENDQVVAVILNITDVGSFYRKNGAWTSEPTVDLEDTQDTTLDPNKVQEFIDLFDANSEELYKNLNQYAVAED